MRRVELPTPRAARRIEIRGPQGRCRTRAHARRAYERVLEDAAQCVMEVRRGWTLWWGGHLGYQDTCIVAWIWPEDDEGGERGATTLVEHFQAAGFVVRRSARPTTPPKVYRTPAVAHRDHVRVGQVVAPTLDYVIVPERDDLFVEHRFDHIVQTCPMCARRVQPLRVVWGEPTRPTAMRDALGEVVCMGCIKGQGDAFCPECSRTFVALLTVSGPSWAWRRSPSPSGRRRAYTAILARPVPRRR